MEQHRWLITVLQDLQIYAETNELHLLTQEIVKTKVVAMSEIDGGANYSPAYSAESLPMIN